MLFFFNVLSFFQFKFDCDFKILYNIFFTNYRYISFLMLNFNDMGLILFCNSFLDGYTTTKMHVWTKWKSSWREKNHPFRRQCHHYQTPVTLTHSNEIHLATQWSEWKSIVTQLKGYWDPMETLSLEKKIKLLYIYMSCNLWQTMKWFYGYYFWILLIIFLRFYINEIKICI